MIYVTKRARLTRNEGKNMSTAKRYLYTNELTLDNWTEQMHTVATFLITHCSPWIKDYYRIQDVHCIKAGKPAKYTLDWVNGSSCLMWLSWPTKDGAMCRPGEITGYCVDAVDFEQHRVRGYFTDGWTIKITGWTPLDSLSEHLSEYATLSEPRTGDGK